MSVTKSSPGKPAHLWAVGILSLLWNLMGAADYVMAKLQTESYVAMMTPQQAAYFNDLPSWITGVWAVGVFAALAGSVLLLLSSRYAVETFGLSLVAIAINLFHGFFLAKVSMADVSGPGEIAFSAVIVVVAVGLAFYAYRLRGAGVLRPR